MGRGSGALRRFKKSLDRLRGVYISSSGESFYPEELIEPQGSIAPYVPSPMDVVKKMLELAELKQGEVLYDLGSGDGRIVHSAAKLFNANAVGVEILENLVEESNRVAEELGVSDSVKFIWGSIFDVDLSSADVVTMYLLTSSNENIRGKLESELKPGARVVTHDFPITYWDPKTLVEFAGSSGKHVLFLYVHS